MKNKAYSIYIVSGILKDEMLAMQIEYSDIMLDSWDEYHETFMKEK